MKKKVINLTPHEITIIKSENEKIKIPSSGNVRLSTVTVKGEDINTELGKIPTSLTQFGGIDYFPPIKEDTIYIVSRMCCEALPNRKDFYIPNEIIRDDAGRILGCSGLSLNPNYKGSEQNEE